MLGGCLSCTFPGSRIAGGVAAVSSLRIRSSNACIRSHVWCRGRGRAWNSVSSTSSTAFVDDHDSVEDVPRAIDSTVHVFVLAVVPVL